MSRRDQGHCLTADSSSMTIANIFSKATVPVITEFYVEPPGAEGMKIRPNCSGHMTIMAAMPIHGKKLSKSLTPEPVD